MALTILVSACAPPSASPPTSTSSTTTTAPAPKTVYEAACDRTLVASNPGTVSSNALIELSGLSASHKNAGVLWAHNDSGDSARVFALGNDGRDLGEYALSGATAADWEDLAVGPGPTPSESYLYVGDIGDNAAARSSVRVYRVPEPAVDAATVSPSTQTVTGVAILTLTYPDGPHNAEALLVDPISGDLYVVTKSFDGVAQVFRAPANLSAGSTTALALVATVSLGGGQLVTAADVTPAGDVVALRTYSSVILYPRPSGSSLADAFAQTSCSGAAASEPQGEAIGFTSDGLGYITASEGTHPALHSFATS